MTASANTGTESPEISNFPGPDVAQLDLSSLQKAVTSLEVALKARAADPANEFVWDSCIQRFEYTYELCHKMLKRYLEATEASADSIDALGFPDLIRTAAERGLVKSGWDVWMVFRNARNITSHTYNRKKAEDVLAVVPDFLEEARGLLAAISERQAAR